MILRIAAVMAAPLCVIAAQAQALPPGSGGDVLTLEEALEAATAYSPASDAAEASLRAAEAGREVAGLRPNPAISIDVENALGTGPYRSLDESETSVAFALPIELGGKRSARIALADARTRRAAVDLVAARAEAKLRVTEAYVSAIAAAQRAGVAVEQLAIVAENFRVARDRVMVGANSPLDEQRAALEQIRARADADSAQQAARAARAELRRHIGDAALAALDELWFDRTAATYGPAVPGDAAGTLALAAASADMLVAEAGLRLARSDRAPDLTLSAGTRRLEATGDQAMLFGVSIPLPLFSGGRAAVDQAARERDRADAERRLALFQAEQAIAAGELERDRAATAVGASGPALESAAEAARIARIGYGEGKFDQMVLLDAERMLLDTRRAAIDARADYHNAVARLARLSVRLSGAGDE